MGAIEKLDRNCRLIKGPGISLEGQSVLGRSLGHRWSDYSRSHRGESAEPILELLAYDCGIQTAAPLTVSDRANGSKCAD